MIIKLFCRSCESLITYFSRSNSALINKETTGQASAVIVSGDYMKVKLPKRNQVESLLGRVQYISTRGILTSNFDLRQEGVKKSLSVLDPCN